MPTGAREEIPLPKLLDPITPYQASVYVTVLNIIQCIALAFLINEAKETIIKREVSLIFMARSIVALTIILVVWHRYVCESQYLWPMSWWDTLIPFSIGLTECVIVFLTNDKVPLISFMATISITQGLAALAYKHAHHKRGIDITIDLYEDSYPGCRNFVSHLLGFLSDYDKKNEIRFAWLFILSLIFLIITLIRPFFLYELIFPAFYVVELIRGEIFGSFHRALSKDYYLRDYFTRI